MNVDGFICPISCLAKACVVVIIITTFDEFCLSYGLNINLTNYWCDKRFGGAVTCRYVITVGAQQIHGYWFTSFFFFFCACSKPKQN